MAEAVLKKPVQNKTDATLKSKTTESPTIFRKTYIEVMRIIAAFLVIVNHTNSDIFLKYSEPESFAWFFSLSYFWISKVAVSVFLMIMGGLLLKKIDSPKKSIQRVLRMVVVLLVTSAVYYIYLHKSDFSSMSLGDFLHTVVAVRTNNAIWYLYTYIGLLILLPILQRMANAFSKRTTEYFIFISVFVMGIVPLLKVFFNLRLVPYLTETFFMPLLGMVFVGFYIENHLNITKKIFALASFLFVFIIAFEVLYSHQMYRENPKNYLQLDNRLHLNILLSAICFYIIFKYISTVMTTKEKSSKIVCYFGSLTFGVYLLSDLIMFITKPYYTKLAVQSEHIIFLTILWEIVIFVACAFITAILKLIPGFKKFI